MRTRRRVFCIVFTLLGLFMDISVLPFTGIDVQYVPRLCLVNIILISTVMGGTRAMVYAAVCGILGDITVYYPPGLISFAYTFAAIIAGFISSRTRPSLVTVIPPLVTFVLYELSMLFALYFEAGYFAASRLGAAGIRTVAALVLVQLLYIPCVRILKPERIGMLNRRKQKGR